MDSAKIFALGLTAGLAIHVYLRNASSKKEQKDGAQKEVAGSIAKAGSSSKKNKNKKKSKDTAPAPPAAAAAAVAAVVEQVKEEVKTVPATSTATAPATAAAGKKNKKKQQKAQQQPSASASAAAAPSDETYAEVASEPIPAQQGLNNETIRAKADAAQTAFTASLGDMRDAEVDPLPSGYSSVARIPAPAQEAEKPRLSKKEVDEGWSSVGSSGAAKVSNATVNGAKANGTGPRPADMRQSHPTTLSLRFLTTRLLLPFDVSLLPNRLLPRTLVVGGQSPHRQSRALMAPSPTATSTPTL